MEHQREIERDSVASAKPNEDACDGPANHQPKKLTFRKKALSIIWDSLDKSPEERAFIAKIDWWVLTYCCVAYFVKYLDQTNVCRTSFSPKRDCRRLQATSR